MIIAMLEADIIDIDNAMKLLSNGFQCNEAQIKLAMETIEMDLP